MAHKKDLEFLDFLLNQTLNHSIKWEPSAEPDQFVVGLKGKYKAQVDKYSDANNHILRLFDDADRELMILENYESENGVRRLYDAALRNSLEVDHAIDEIMGDSKAPQGPITDEDIPF